MSKKKNVMATIVILLLIFMIEGCKTYKADFVKNYKDFLKYSLGDFQVSKQPYRWTSYPVPNFDEGIEWTLSYKNVSGKDSTFVFNNVTNRDNDDKMGYQVYFQAYDICSGEIGEKLCSRYFDYIRDESSVPKEDLPVTYSLVKGDFNLPFGDSFYSECLDKNHGLQLRSITAAELINKWKGAFKLSIITAETKDNEKLNNILARTKSMLKDYSEYLNLDNVTASIDYSEDVQLYTINYDRKKSDFTVKNIREEEAKKQSEDKVSLESDNYIDGHKSKIDTYIVNNKKLVWLKGAQYNKETKMYDLFSPIELLGSLGIKVQDVDSGSKYKWQIGNDLYEVSINDYPQKILKNNYVIAGPFDQISCKDFELISNSTVIIDEKKEVIIINSK